MSFFISLIFRMYNPCAISAVTRFFEVTLPLCMQQDSNEFKSKTKENQTGGNVATLKRLSILLWSLVSNPQPTTGKSGTIEGNHMTARRLKKRQQIESEGEENKKINLMKGKEQGDLKTFVGPSRNMA